MYASDMAGAGRKLCRPDEAAPARANLLRWGYDCHADEGKHRKVGFLHTPTRVHTSNCDEGRSDTAMSRRIDAAIAVGVAAAAAALFLWRTRRAHARTSSLRVHSFRPPKVAVGALLSPSVTLTVGDAAPADTDILLLFLEGVTNSDAMAAKLAALPNLRAVIIPFAGPTEPMRTALASEVERRAREGLPKLPLLNSHHNAPMTAEMAVALLLACAKRLLPADAALRRGDWSARASRCLAGRARRRRRCRSSRSTAGASSSSASAPSASASPRRAPRSA